MGDLILPEMPFTELPLGHEVKLLVHFVSGGKNERKNKTKTSTWYVEDGQAVVCSGFRGGAFLPVSPEPKSGSSVDISEFPTSCRIQPGLRIKVELKARDEHAATLVGKVVYISASLYASAYIDKGGKMRRGIKAICMQKVVPLRAIAHPGVRAQDRPFVTMPVTQFASPAPGSSPLRQDMDEDGLRVHGAITDVETFMFVGSSIGDKKEPRLQLSASMNGTLVHVHGYAPTTSLGLGNGKETNECAMAWERFAIAYIGIAQPVCSAEIDGPLTSAESMANSGRVSVRYFSLPMPTDVELARISLSISADTAKKIIDAMEPTLLEPPIGRDTPFLMAGNHSTSRGALLAAVDAGCTIWWIPGHQRKINDTARAVAAVQNAAKMKGDDAARIAALNETFGTDPRQCLLLIVPTVKATGVDAVKEITTAWTKLFASLAASKDKRAREEDPAAAPAPAPKEAKTESE